MSAPPITAGQSITTGQSVSPGKSITTGQSGKTGGYLISSAAARGRALPTPGRIARRRFMITLTKWLLPFGAMVLLALIALWPELQRTAIHAQIGNGHLTGEVEGGRMIDLRYNGVDEKGRPYTVTAETAKQADPERIVLTMPKGDITLENGTWLMVTSKDGTYIQKLGQLDLLNDVVLYRDDGTTMHTAAASVDLKAGAAASSMPVHAEGPFGVLDAEGFILTDKGAAVDFPGPAHLVLNGTGP